MVCELLKIVEELRGRTGPPRKVELVQGRTGRANKKRRAQREEPSHAFKGGAAWRGSGGAERHEKLKR